MRSIRMPIAAVCSLALATVTSVAEDIIIDVHSINNCGTNHLPGVPVTLGPGRMLITPIGPAQGGAFTAWNAWGGNVSGCDPNTGGSCTNGWLNGYLVRVNGVNVAIPNANTWETPQLALAAASSHSFTLCSKQTVTFFIGDNFCNDNIGGVSLLVSTSGCTADVDADDAVGVSDLLMLLGEWGPCTACSSDLNCDGTVGVTDLLELLAHWGPCS